MYLNDNSPVIDKNTCKSCFTCECEITPDQSGYFTFYYIHKFRGTERHQYYQCCQKCFIFDELILDARIEKRRFTELSAKRCWCGAAVVKSLNLCIKCSVRSRFLERKEIQLLTNRKIINNLLKDMKCQKSKQQDSCATS